MGCSSVVKVESAVTSEEEYVDNIMDCVSCLIDLHM